MPDEQQRSTLRHVIGRAVRELRETAGQRQEDVARAAREHGLTWSSSKVAALERGEKALPAEELVLLPLILYMAGCGNSGSLSSLVSGADVVDLNSRMAMPADAMRAIIDGRFDDVNVRSFDTPESRAAAATDWVAAEENMRRAVAGWRALGYQSVSLAQLSQAKGDAAGDAEQTAARRLDMPVRELALAARATWGRSLTAERDARVEVRVVGVDPRAVRAARGHVTRELYRELRPAAERWRTAVESNEGESPDGQHPAAP